MLQQHESQAIDIIFKFFNEKPIEIIQPKNQRK